MKPILLSGQGSDRATAYTMNSKMVSVPDGLLCTWLDFERQNRWTLVDPASGAIIEAGLLGGKGLDNHCGATLVQTGDIVHAVVGGHHSPMSHWHYDSARRTWEPGPELRVEGTYPSLVADASGRLHLTFRARKPDAGWRLNYSRFENGEWSDPRELMIAEKQSYIYWTNALTIGPDQALYLALGNTRVGQDASLYYGASLIVSRDGGENWMALDGAALSLPASVRSIPLITDPEDPARVQSLGEQQIRNEPGPAHFHYQQINLSNPVVDLQGTPHVIVHNGLDGSAGMASWCDGKWSWRSLNSLLPASEMDRRFHLQSSLSLGAEGKLHAVLMVLPKGKDCTWGPPGTSLLRMIMHPVTGATEWETVGRSDPGVAQWLPALARPGAIPGAERPPLLFTQGINAGGFGNNQNAVRCQVFLDLGN